MHAVQNRTVLHCKLVVKIVESAGVLLFPVLDGFQLVDSRPVVCRVSPERDIQMLQRYKRTVEKTWHAKW